jgi:hypothetical protein
MQYQTEQYYVNGEYQERWKEVVSVYLKKYLHKEMEDNHEKPQSEQSGFQVIQPQYTIH